MSILMLVRSGHAESQSRSSCVWSSSLAETQLHLFEHSMLRSQNSKPNEVLSECIVMQNTAFMNPFLTRENAGSCTRLHSRSRFEAFDKFCLDVCSPAASYRFLGGRRHARFRGIPSRHSRRNEGIKFQCWHQMSSAWTPDLRHLRVRSNTRLRLSRPVQLSSLLSSLGATRWITPVLDNLHA